MKSRQNRVYICVLLCFLLMACGGGEEYPQDCPEGQDLDCSADKTSFSSEGLSVGGIAGIAGGVVLVGALVSGNSGEAGDDDNGDSSNKDTNLVTSQAANNNIGGELNNSTLNNSVTPVNQKVQANIQGVYATVSKKNSSTLMRGGNEARSKGLDRNISGETIKLVNGSGQTISRTTTNSGGHYTFVVDITIADYPLILQAESDPEYQTALITPATKTVANINDVTAAITKKFLSTANRSQEAFESFATEVLINRFGSNEIKQPNVALDTFYQGDFQNPNSLGAVIIAASAESNIDLINTRTPGKPVFIEPNFVNALAQELKAVPNSNETLSALSTSGSLVLVNNLVALAAASAAEVFTLSIKIVSQFQQSEQSNISAQAVAEQTSVQVVATTTLPKTSIPDSTTSTAVTSSTSTTNVSTTTLASGSTNATTTSSSATSTTSLTLEQVLSSLNKSTTSTTLKQSATTLNTTSTTTTTTKPTTTLPTTTTDDRTSITTTTSTTTTTTLPTTTTDDRTNITTTTSSTTTTTLPTTTTDDRTNVTTTTSSTTTTTLPTTTTDARTFISFITLSRVLEKSESYGHFD